MTHEYPCGVKDSSPGTTSLYIRIHLIYAKLAHRWTMYAGLYL